MISNVQPKRIKKRLFNFLTFLNNLSFEASRTSSFTLVHLDEYDTSTGRQALTYTQINFEGRDHTMDSIFDNWAQGAVVVLQTAGGVITGTIVNIGEDFINLSNATINGIAVTLATLESVKFWLLALFLPLNRPLENVLALRERFPPYYRLTTFTGLWARNFSKFSTAISNSRCLVSTAAHAI